jgi:hypothetical protein
MSENAGGWLKFGKAGCICACTGVRVVKTWIPDQVRHDGGKVWCLFLERFRLKRNHENALSFCFYAFPDAKPVPTFAGNALAPLAFGSKGFNLHKRKYNPFC